MLMGPVLNHIKTYATNKHEKEEWSKKKPGGCFM
jgi:hypothetical protein